MNKRIKNKQTRAKNRNKIKEILDVIRLDFKIYNIVYLNSYFIFERGDSSICHFKIKETPNWEYGIWLKSDGSYEIFGEHIECIDKFKPSATYLSDYSNLDEFKSDIFKISQQPVHYYVDTCMGDAFVDFYYNEKYDSYFGYQVVRKYNKETNRYDIIERDKSITQEDYIDKMIKEIKEDDMKEFYDKVHDKNLVFDYLKSLPIKNDNIVAVAIRDGNYRTGWITRPRYIVTIVLKKYVINSDKMFGDFCDKITEEFRNINYDGDKKTYEYRFSLADTLYSENEVDKLKNSHYMFYKDSKLNKYLLG